MRTLYPSCAAAMVERARVLETTLAGDFVPASNLKGHVAGANWTFLLPHLSFNLIVWIGTPSTAAIETLARVGRHVVIVCPGKAAGIALRDFSRRRGFAGVHTVRASSRRTPLAPHSADLLVLNGPASQHVSADERLRVLADGGLVYDADGHIDGHVKGHKRQAFRLTPIRGEMKTAVPAEDTRTSEYFTAHGYYGRTLRVRFFKRIERFVNQMLARLVRRQGVLSSHAPQDVVDAPPGYLRAVAADAGLNLDGYRWGLAAHGEYTSRKILFLLFTRHANAPIYVVKMTRDGALNWRLENEHRALDLLHAMNLGDVQRLPRVAFAGTHGGLAIVGETYVPGAPFETRSDGTVDCPYLRSALQWLTALAEQSRRESTSDAFGGGLRLLFERFLSIYRFAPSHERFMQSQIDALACGCPTVFQHGDPGTWNLVATPRGHAGFLDWEAFEPRGIPLWDLFYLMRAYGSWSTRRRRLRMSPAEFAQQMTRESAFGQLVAASIRDYCARARFEQTLAEPLFYTCWMHRAIKEAARLPVAKADNGYFVRLLRSCIDRRDALRATLSGSTPPTTTLSSN